MAGIRFDDFEDFSEEDAAKVLRGGTGRPSPDGKHYVPSGEDSGKWAQVFQTHPPSAGPFKGQDNALTALVGFLRAKSVPFDAAVPFALWWNEAYCEAPRLEPEYVRERISRAWVEWQAGGMEDETPENLKAKKSEPKTRQLLTIDDLLDMDENGLGLDWLVPNVFVRGGTHFVSAPAAGAKSWMMLDLSRAVASGVPWLEQYEVGQGAVLYVDEEMGGAKTGKRVRQLGFGRGVPFYYMGKQGIEINNPDDLKFIVETCIEKNVVLCCIDTLTGVRPGLQENESSHVSQLRSYFNAITATNATLIVAHHDRKSGQGDSETAHYRMAGSRDFGAMADMAYGIESRGSYFHMTVTKNRLTAKEDEMQVDFALEDSEDKSRVTLRVIDAAERSDRIIDQTEERVVAVLQQHGRLNTSTICDNVKATRSSVIAALKRMGEDGRLTFETVGNAKFYDLP